MKKIHIVLGAAWLVLVGVATCQKCESQPRSINWGGQILTNVAFATYPNELPTDYSIVTAGGKFRWQTLGKSSQDYASFREALNAAWWDRNGYGGAKVWNKVTSDPSKQTEWKEATFDKPLPPLYVVYYIVEDKQYYYVSDIGKNDGKGYANFENVWVAAWREYGHSMQVNPSVATLKAVPMKRDDSTTVSAVQCTGDVTPVTQ
jgi:hypothetical protein